MRTTILAAMLVVVAVALVGCGSGMPSWYPNAPQDPLYLRSANAATSQDMQVAIDKASTGARAELGRMLETKVNALQKRFEDETGVGQEATLLAQFTQATKLVVSTTMNGSKMKDQKTIKEGDLYRAFVMMELPIGSANETLLQEIKNNKDLYTRFRASETYKELDTEVQKYEQFKKEMK
jgi:hypothetical protein